MDHKAVLAMLIASIGLSGCASSDSTLLTSLEDISTQSQRQGAFDINQNRIVSIAGLLGGPDVGTMQRFKHGRAASTAIGITEEPTSFYITSTIPASSSSTSILRDKLLEAREFAADAISKRLRVTDARKDKSKTTAAVEATQREYETARTAFETSLKQAMAEVKPGMLVFRWSTNREESGGVSAGSLLDAGASSSRATSGFGILNGVRLSTLYVGKDLKDVTTGQVPTTEWFTWQAPFLVSCYQDRNVRLVTHVLQSKEVSWIQDTTLASRVAANLDASYRQLQNLSGALSPSDKIEINYLLERLDSLSNMGTMAGVEYERKELGKWSIDKDHLSSVKGWLTVYEVDTDLDDLRELYHK
jgi:hypothetical protein